MGRARFCVATNFKDDLIPRIRHAPVREIFGKLPSDAVGGLRPSYLLPRVDKDALARHVAQAHAAGIEFNYLLNAACLDNREFTRGWRREFENLLGWLEEIGVDSVTVTIPYLLEIVKRKSRLRTRISIMAGVDSVQRARRWLDLGADEITLPPQINRDFQLLAALRKHLPCPIVVLANVGCLHECPFALYHGSLHSHASQAWHPSGGYFIDYCAIRCVLEMLRRPWNYLAANWIRPEDVRLYEEIGIDGVKLAERAADSKTIERIVDAYARGRYDGNLLDLIPRLSGESIDRHELRWLRTFFRPFSVNVFQLRRLLRLLAKPKVVIDNRGLDGFLEGLRARDCGLLGCDDCGYCKEAAERMVRIDPAYREAIEANYTRALNGLVTGDVFRYPFQRAH